MRSLTPRWRMQPASRPVADTFIKPNDRLTSFERLEIYNRQYWFRLIDCFYDRFGLQGAMITAVDLLAGIAACIGWERLSVPGMTSCRPVFGGRAR